MSFIKIWLATFLPLFFQVFLTESACYRVGKGKSFSFSFPCKSVVFMSDALKNGITVVSNGRLSSGRFKTLNLNNESLNVTEMDEDWVGLFKCQDSENQWTQSLCLANTTDNTQNSRNSGNDSLEQTPLSNLGTTLITIFCHYYYRHY